MERIPENKIAVLLASKSPAAMRAGGKNAAVRMVLAGVSVPKLFSADHNFSGLPIIRAP